MEQSRSGKARLTACLRVSASGEAAGLGLMVTELAMELVGEE